MLLDGPAINILIIEITLFEWSSIILPARALKFANPKLKSLLNFNISQISLGISKACLKLHGRVHDHPAPEFFTEYSCLRTSYCRNIVSLMKH